MQVRRKRIKNLNLRLDYPQVKVSAPLYVSKKQIQQFVQKNWPWVLQQIQQQPPPLQYTTGEKHLFQGRSYKLQVWHHICQPGVWLIDDHNIELHTPPNSSTQQRQALFNNWYKKHTLTQAWPLIQKWQPFLGVQVHALKAQPMKSCWGTCNLYTKCIRINSEIMKKPRPALEYIVMHEMVHLLEKNHTPLFYKWLDKFMPTWREHEKLLDAKNPPQT